MKIAVMGAGALGCYFGGRLAAAGEDVSFIARGAHLEAMRRDGLRVESPLGDLHLTNVRATDDPAEIGPVDLVMFLVKLYDTDEAAKAIAPLIGPDTAVISFQNGVDGWKRIGAVFGAERVIGGTAVIPVTIASPGVVRHDGDFARLDFGEFDGSDSERCRAFLAALHSAGVDAGIAPDIEVQIWRKFMMLSALSAVTALTRRPVGEIRDNPVSAELITRAILETFAVGRAVCPRLPEDAGQKALQMAAGLPHGMRASMLDDLERGKPLEVDSLSGAVVRLAAENGLEAPTHDVVWRALQPYAKGRPREA